MSKMGFKTLFGCDLRTLALFRVSLALVLLTDLINRAEFLTAHYTDFGILPRTDAIAWLAPWRLSIHLFNGSTFFQALLFIIAGLFALALLIGYRTRLATIVSWFLLLSLLNRNPILLQGGDTLLLLLLFWGMFLPLGARYSVDAALNPNPPAPNAYFSVATLGLLLQCMSVYFFTALLKSGSEWIPQGTAVYYALHLDSFATPLGAWLAQFFPLLQLLAYFVWLIELIGPFLLFSPWFHLPLRLSVLFLLICMHIGFYLCLEIGLFPFISLTSLLTLTPGWVWDKLEQKWAQTKERQGIKLYFDQGCEFCRKTCLLLRTFLLLPATTPIQPAQQDPRISKILEENNSWVVQDHDGQEYIRWAAIVLVFRRSPLFWPLAYLFGSRLFRTLGDRIYYLIGNNRSALGRFTAVWLPYRSISVKLSDFFTVIVTALVIYMLFINLNNLPGSPLHKVPDPFGSLKQALRLNQRWDMFAPYPAKTDGWFVIRGELENDKLVDVYHGALEEPSWEKPEYISQDFYQDYRWRKYMLRLTANRYKDHVRYYGRYLCRLWNKTAAEGERLGQFKIYYNKLRTQPDYQARTLEKRMIWHHWCLEKYNPKNLTQAINKL